MVQRGTRGGGGGGESRFHNAAARPWTTIPRREQSGAGRETGGWIRIPTITEQAWTNLEGEAEVDVLVTCNFRCAIGEGKHKMFVQYTNHLQLYIL